MDITKPKANAEKRKEAANVCRSVAKTLEQYANEPIIYRDTIISEFIDGVRNETAMILPLHSLL